MKAIFKYALPTRGPRELVLPMGARILSVANQYEKVIALWAEVDPKATQTETRRFYVAMTGEEFVISPSSVFIGTVLLADGSYVAHVYEVRF